jgi:hypothetical protein
MRIVRYIACGRRAFTGLLPANTSYVAALSAGSAGHRQPPGLDRHRTAAIIGGVVHKGAVADSHASPIYPHRAAAAKEGTVILKDTVRDNDRALADVERATFA